MKKFSVNVDVTEDTIIDMFITACEGGSNYWCKELTPLGKSKDAYRAMLKGFTLVDLIDGRKYTVSEQRIEKAITKMALQEPRHFRDMVAEEGDACTADVFLQLCVFDKVIYG